jgi:heterodisulfide reductase subunit A-like polyferredoxin
VGGGHHDSLAVICTLAIELAACAAEVDRKPVEVDTADRSASFDVITVGVGASGIAAAIQAARMGRAVALLESSGHIGGQLLTVTSMDAVGRRTRRASMPRFAGA